MRTVYWSQTPTGTIITGERAAKAMGLWPPEDFGVEAEDLYYTEEGQYPLDAVCWGPHCALGTRTLPPDAWAVLDAWYCRSKQPIPEALVETVQATPLYWLEWMADRVRKVLYTMSESSTGLTNMVDLVYRTQGNDPVVFWELRIVLKELRRIQWIECSDWDAMSLTVAGEAALAILDPES